MNVKKKPLPVAALAAIDILLSALALCIFALFHHVLPQSLEPEPLPVTQAADTEESSALTASEDESGRFDDMFTDGEIVQTALTYKSGNISVETKRVQTGAITYYIQDIYVAELKYLRTAFAHDTFGKGISESVKTIAVNNGAIAAVNGDYYGTHSERGVVVRNGQVYRWKTAFNDVCVLYDDGTVKLYGKDYYNEYSLSIIEGAWQGWCFGPALVTDGVASGDFSDDGDISGLNPRTGFGYFEPGHYCFVVVDGRQDESEGITLADFAQLFLELGCEQAYNLDGGQSSEMIFGGGIVNSPAGGEREQSDIIYITEITD